MSFLLSTLFVPITSIFALIVIGPGSTIVSLSGSHYLSYPSHRRSSRFELLTSLLLLSRLFSFELYICPLSSSLLVKSSSFLLLRVIDVSLTQPRRCLLEYASHFSLSQYHCLLVKSSSFLSLRVAGITPAVSPTTLPWSSL